MYKNLQFEMLQDGITQKDIAACLGVHENSVGNKIRGKNYFTIEEAFKIKNAFFQKCELSYLFRKTSKQTQDIA
jgi:Plasmid maintenance system antidote protein